MFEVDVDQSVARRQDLSPRRAALWLGVITLLAAVLRAAALRYPPALTDEAFTFWRVSGRFGQLLDNLRGDAFVPLNYEVIWLLTKIFGTGVWVMRLPSAAAGVLLPFAVYRLGRLVGGRRVGLIAAAVAAGSAFLGFYARNAKMYLPAWLLMTLALGSLLCFARGRHGTGSRRLALLTFVLFGAAATLTHAVVCIPLALSPAVVLVWARRRRWTAAAIALVATAVVLAGPLIYYTCINTWFDRAGGLSGRSETGPALRDNGLLWISDWQAGRSAQNVLLECLSDYTAGIEWPGDDDSDEPGLARWVCRVTGGVMIALASATVVAVGIAVVRGRHRRDGAALAVLLLTVVVPVYGFYLRSFRTFTPPWELGGAAAVVLALSCVAMWTGMGRWRRRAFAVGGWVVFVLLTLTVTWAAARYAYAHAPQDENGQPRWNPLWMPRYSGFAAPLLCVLIGSVVAATPTRPLRWGLGGAVVGLNLWLTAMPLLTPTEVPWGALAGDLVWASHTPGAVVAMDWVYFPGQAYAPPLPGPSYELIHAAGVPVDPPAFRTGETWPFRPGPAVQKLLATLHYSPASQLRRVAAGPNVDTIVLWRTKRDATFAPYVLPGWHVTARQTYAVRSVWTWHLYRGYERLVLRRE